jgi:hypothetical protein
MSLAYTPQFFAEECLCEPLAWRAVDYPQLCHAASRMTNVKGWKPIPEAKDLIFLPLPTALFPVIVEYMWDPALVALEQFILRHLGQPVKTFRTVLYPEDVRPVRLCEESLRCRESEKYYPVAVHATQVKPIFYYLSRFQPSFFDPLFLIHLMEQMITCYGEKGSSLLESWNSFLISLRLNDFFTQHSVTLIEPPLHLSKGPLVFILQVASTILYHAHGPWKHRDFLTFLYERLVDALCFHFLDQGMGLILRSLLRQLCSLPVPYGESNRWYVPSPDPKKKFAQSWNSRGLPLRPPNPLWFFFFQHLNPVEGATVTLSVSLTD